MDSWNGCAEAQPNGAVLLAGPMCSLPAQVVSSLAQLNKRKMRDRFKVSEYGSKPLVNDQDVRRTRPRLGTMGTIGWPLLVCVALNLPLSTRCLGSARAKHEANLRGLLARLHDPVLAGRPLAPGDPYRVTSLTLRWTL